MRPLPQIMVAPNGARLTRKDHPAVPVTIPEIVACTRDCAAAGADGLHAHVRDAAQHHVLDAGLYAELIAEIETVLPGFYMQITTEAVGHYSPEQQRELIYALRPAAASIALREITQDQGNAVTAQFFHDCRDMGVGVQHILYDTSDVEHLARLVDSGVIPSDNLMALIVLGRYAPGQKSTPADLGAPASALLQHLPETDWAVCAFGAEETACLMAARNLGGKSRIGFENNRLNGDFTCAPDNASRVAELVRAINGATSRTEPVE